MNITSIILLALLLTTAICGCTQNSVPLESTLQSWRVAASKSDVSTFRACLSEKTNGILDHQAVDTREGCIQVLMGVLRSGALKIDKVLIDGRRANAVIQVGSDEPMEIEMVLEGGKWKCNLVKEVRSTVDAINYVTKLRQQMERETPVIPPRPRASP